MSKSKRQERRHNRASAERADFRGGAGQHQAAQSEAGQSEAGQSEAGQSEAGQSEAGQSEAAQSETAQPWQPNVKPLIKPVQEMVRSRYTPARMRTLNLPLPEIHRDGLRALNASFTTSREERSVAYLSGPRARGAYLLYYSFTGAATTQAVLRRGSERGAWDHLPTDRPIRVLDLGAGPLTATLGLALAWPDRELDVTAVDGAKAALQDGAALLEAIAPGTRVRLEVGNLRDGALRQRLGGDYDVVLLANVLNEFRESSRHEDTEYDPGSARSPAERLLRDVISKRLAPNGRLVIIEPGARAPSRLLISLRDRLVQDEAAEVLAPCLGAPTCPLSSVHNRDWCHAEQPWKRPRPVAACDRVLGRRRDVLKYSYLILGRPGEGVAPPAKTWRLIGGAMGSTHGMQRRYVCGSAERVVILDNSGSAAFRDALRGDLLVVPGMPIAGRRPGEWELRLPRQPRGAGGGRRPSAEPRSGVKDGPARGRGQDEQGQATPAKDQGAAKTRRPKVNRPKVDRQDRPFYSKRRKKRPSKGKK